MGSQSRVVLSSTRTSPDVGSSNRLISFKVVVFPDPLRPRRTIASPDSTLNGTFSTRERPLMAYAASRNSRVVAIRAVYHSALLSMSAHYNHPMLSWVDIDPERLKKNIETFRSITVPGTALMVVVKANAYGHGLETVAPVVAEHADWLGVNCIYEALAITRLGISKPVAILGHTPPEQANEIVHNRFRQVLYRLDVAKALNESARRFQMTA